MDPIYKGASRNKGLACPAVLVASLFAEDRLVHWLLRVAPSEWRGGRECRGVKGRVVEQARISAAAIELAERGQGAGRGRRISDADLLAERQNLLLERCGGRSGEKRLPVLGGPCWWVDGHVGRLEGRELVPH